MSPLADPSFLGKSALNVLGLLIITSLRYFEISRDSMYQQMNDEPWETER
jgi:hypothetical protein